jgi:poly(3-hydroxybutyrate) depolymerase
MDGPMSARTPMAALTDLALAPLRIAGTALDGWVHYTETAVTRVGPELPLQVGADLLTWWSTLAERQRPSWAHEAPVVWRWPLAQLRDYSTDPPGTLTPTLVLPPQAGHDSCIVDYAPGQSQLVTLREAGLTRLFTLDWLGADPDRPDTVHAGIEEYLELLHEAVELLGGRANLVGDCQGGWLATIYAALHPERVATLTVAGAPIDTHAGRGPLLDWTRLLGWLGRLSGAGQAAPYRAMVAMGGGVQRGANQLLGFQILEPAGQWQRDLSLLAHIREPEYVARYREFADWFAWTQDIPGEFYLWAVERLFQRNELATGQLRVDGRRVDLGAITCPLFLLAGTEDHITPPEQVWALAELAGTPPEQVHREQVPGGHLGLFMGRRSLREHWTPLAATLRTLS